MWGFYQLKLVSDTPGPGFRVRSKHEGKRKRGCPSPLLHARPARLGHSRPAARRARRHGRADQVGLADRWAVPGDRACLRAVLEDQVAPEDREVPAVHLQVMRVVRLLPRLPVPPRSGCQRRRGAAPAG